MIKSTTHLAIITVCSFCIYGLSGCKRGEWLSPKPVVDSVIVAGAAPAGFANGQDTAARFNHPFGLALDAAGNLYVADQGNQLIRKIDPTLLVTTFAGTVGTRGALNGQDTSSSFNKPFGVAVDGTGKVYVADAGNNLIRVIGPAGLVSTFAGTGAAGAANGTDTATFNSPLGVAVDGAGNVYVADYGNDIIRKITPAGVVSTLAGSGATGADNGVGTAATFNLPESVAVDAAGNVYVADNGNNLIRKITPDGTVSTLAGNGIAGSANGTGAAASFNSPFGIAVDATGNIYVADSGNNLIRKVTPAGVVSTFAGNGKKGAGNAGGTSASFNTPSGVAVDAAGNVFVSDENNNLIRRITAAGVVTTLANRPAKGFFVLK
ncbi:MAG TPA: NHL repeat-containing protein [Mucilaginibacter sp.]|nr:NHL repeat-containing protein [Mucilaginibacter sp.]